MWPSTQRIGKDIGASSNFFTRRAADVVPEACFTAITEDRHLSVIAVALTLFCSVLFLIMKLYLLYECELCLISITVHKLAI